MKVTDIRILATDLDGTFIGDPRAMTELWRDLEAAGITVVFATGRHLDSIESFYRESGTDRRAAACITMVGTEVWTWHEGGYRLDPEWTARIESDWDAAAVDTALVGVPGIEPQPAEWQSPHKRSYFADRQAAAAVRRLLDSSGISAKVIHSAERFLDVLPAASGKGDALRFLAARWGAPAGQVMTAGDTGNDIDMMRPELGFRSIAVGNAAPELAGYRAARLYHASAPFAAGIREGLEHYGWFDRPESSTRDLV